MAILWVNIQCCVYVIVWMRYNSYTCVVGSVCVCVYFSFACRNPSSALEIPYAFGIFSLSLSVCYVAANPLSCEIKLQMELFCIFSINQTKNIHFNFIPWDPHQVQIICFIHKLRIGMKLGDSEKIPNRFIKLKSVCVCVFRCG